MKFTRKIKETFITPKYVKFFITGISGFVVDLAIFTIGIKSGLPVITANIISVSIALIVNYSINRLWVFQSKNKQVGIELGKFLGVQTFNFFMNTTFLVIFNSLRVNTILYSILNSLQVSTNILQFVAEDDTNKLMAKILATSIQMVTSFLLYKLIVFKGDSDTEEN